MSNAPIKNGKKPINEKKNPFINGTNAFTDRLALDPELIAELDSQNLHARWEDAQTCHANGGYDQMGWVVYKRKLTSSGTIGLSDLKFGQDPSGVIRNGSLILQVMDKERYAQFREYEQHKSDRLMQNLNKKKAQELRQTARSAQVDAEIHEGYEDNE